MSTRGIPIQVEYTPVGSVTPVVIPETDVMRVETQLSSVRQGIDAIAGLAESGRAVITLRNRSGQWAPSYQGGLPQGAKVEVFTTVGEEKVYLWGGYYDDIAPTARGRSRYAAFNCYGAITYLLLPRFQTAIPITHDFRSSGSLITEVLDAAGWAAEERGQIDAGVDPLSVGGLAFQGILGTAQNLRTPGRIIEGLAVAEPGVFREDNRGRVEFADRNRNLRPDKNETKFLLWQSVLEPASPAMPLSFVNITPAGNPINSVVNTINVQEIRQAAVRTTQNLAAVNTGDTSLVGLENDGIDSRISTDEIVRYTITQTNNVVVWTGAYVLVGSDRSAALAEAEAALLSYPGSRGYGYVLTEEVSTVPRRVPDYDRRITRTFQLGAALDAGEEAHNWRMAYRVRLTGGGSRTYRNRTFTQDDAATLIHAGIRLSIQGGANGCVIYFRNKPSSIVGTPYLAVIEAITVTYDVRGYTLAGEGTLAQNKDSLDRYGNRPWSLQANLRVSREQSEALAELIERSFSRPALSWDVTVRYLDARYLPVLKSEVGELCALRCDYHNINGGSGFAGARLFRIDAKANAWEGKTLLMTLTLTDVEAYEWATHGANTALGRTTRTVSNGGRTGGALAWAVENTA